MNFNKCSNGTDHNDQYHIELGQYMNQYTVECINCGFSYSSPVKKSILHDHFNAVFCLNLERRKDRKQEVFNEFNKFGIYAEFIYGIDGKNLFKSNIISSDNTPVSQGDMGCTLSHLKIARLAKQRGIEQYFVFEDDVELADNFNEVFDNYIKQVPEDWDMIYLGGNHMGGTHYVMPNVAKIFRTYTTHAYAIRGRAIDAIIEELGKENEKVDIAISNIHEKYNCYVIRPHLAFQRASHSDILEKFTDYQHLRV